MMHRTAMTLIRRGIRSVLLWGIALTSFATTEPAFAAEEDSTHGRPNILWITAEDMSPTLGCYGDDYAKTPNIDRLALQSVKYTHAFATAPVCSPSRSCLITGCYATSLGTQQMRSAFPLPSFMNGFPALLRNAGYYTSNNYKTDYNTSSAGKIIAKSWDGCSTTAHWRDQSSKAGQSTNKADQASTADAKPFFSIFNLMTSHQSRSMVWTQARFRKEVQSQVSQGDVHDPDLAPIPPYYPDTLVTRRIVARYYDCVTAMDAEVGRILRELDDDHLSEDTIVFFYSDHGSGMPRHKRLLHDSGMHVPLLIRFPKKWQHLAPKQPGQSTDRLVSFVDFPPTVLQLAGVDHPDYMQGKSFLGEGTDSKEAKRKYIYGHRDRIDEVIDCSRSVRDKRFLYIRNYMPHHSWNQYSSYSDLSEIRHEFYSAAERQSLTPTQASYAGPQKPPEELYDCKADPFNVNNLVDASEHAEKLRELRDASRAHLIATRDLGFIPEITATRLFAGSTPWEVARQAGFDQHELAAWTANSLLSLGSEHAAALLDESAPSARYWGAIALASRDTLSIAARAKLQEALRSEGDSFIDVRIAAANALAVHGHLDDALPVLIKALEHHDLVVVLQATRAIELLGEKAKSAVPAMQRIAERTEKLQATTTQAVFDQSGEKDLAMFCSFSANGFLDRIKNGPWNDLLHENNHSKWNAEGPGVEFDAEQQQVDMLSKGKNLWIFHEQKFSDFELTADVKMPEDDYNAGIAFRCQVAENGRPKGYQCEVADALSGSLYAIGSGGWVWPRGDDQRKQFFDKVGSAFRTGKWNHFRIRCEDAQLRIWVNGILTTDVLDEKHTMGQIGLQHHGKGGNHLYRNVRIRSLN